MTVELISANHAAAMAATLAGRANRNGRGFGSGVYPITPQTECIELLCRQEFEKGEVVRVESEHSAMAVCMGLSFCGARSFTASSSNGLAYMTENVFAAAFYRLPIVMMAVNRTLGPPWNIWVDHKDTLMLRDSGWVQIYCEDNQEVLDSIILGFRIGEDRRLLMPVLVCQDAFVLSHTMMPTEVPEQEEVDAFLPPLDLPHRIDPMKPRTVGGLDFPHETEVHHMDHHIAMERMPEVYRQVQDEFEQQFGRRPADRVVPYALEDADTVLVSMGTTHATVRAVVDAARARGEKVGAVRIRMYRPWPNDLLTKYLVGKKRIGVLDRNLAPGIGGIVWSELRGLVDTGKTVVQDYVLGIGGGDIRPPHLSQVLADLAERETAGAPKLMEVAS